MNYPVLLNFRHNYCYPVLLNFRHNYCYNTRVRATIVYMLNYLHTRNILHFFGVLNSELISKI